MKILYVMRNMWGGGAPKRFWNLHGIIAKSGFEVTLLTTRNASTYRDFDPSRFPEINVIALKIQNRYADAFFYPKAMKTVNKLKTKFDLIHDDISPATTYSYFFHQNTIATVHEVIRNPVKRYGIRGAILSINQSLYNLMGYKAFVVPSMSTKKELERLGEKIFIVPNGIDPEKFKPCEEYRNDKRITISMISRFVPVKGHFYFLKVAEKLCKKYDNIQFYLPSDGPLFQEVRATAERMKLPIVFPGFLSDENQVVEILQKTDIYVSTSLQEGFGISICEAMACEIPIVGFDVPGVRDIITSNCGFLTPVEDVSLMVSKIELLINDIELRKRMGKAARERILNEYTWERAARKMIEVYRNVSL